MVAANHHWHGGAHSGGVRRRLAGPPRTLPPPRRNRRRARHRILRRRARRPLRPAAAGGGVSAASGRHQIAVPQKPMSSASRSARKGAVLAFRENIFSNPEGLIAFINKHPEGARVRPDMKVVFFDEWESAPERLKGCDRDFADVWLGSRRRAPRRRSEPSPRCARRQRRASKGDGPGASARALQGPLRSQHSTCLIALKL